MSNFLLKDPDCVLIHIPKTAGTSIRSGVWKGRYEGPFFGPLPENLKPYFAFAFTRHPVDRLLSTWRMFSCHAQNRAREDLPWQPDPSLTVQDVLDIAEDDRIRYDESRATFQEIVRHHAIPQTHPFNALQDADYVGRYETLHEDWMRVCEHIGRVYEPLPKVNVTAGQKPTPELSPALHERIRTVYKEDFQQLGYE